MALTSSSTESDATNQYYDNIGGWRQSTTQAALVQEAMEWLLLKHRANSLTIAGRTIVLSPGFDQLREEVGKFIATSSTSRPALFSRARVQGGGRW